MTNGLPPLVRLDFGPRPNGSPTECFYCRQQVDTPHKADCVMWTKNVRVRMTVEYEREVPMSWDDEAVDFQLSESSWCADNAIPEIREFVGPDGCICSITTFEVISS